MKGSHSLLSSLIAKIQQVSCVFLYKFSKLTLKFKMLMRFAGHCACTHRVEHAKFCGGLRIGFFYFRVIAEFS